MLLWLFFFIGIEKLSGSDTNITTISFIIAISLLISLLLPFYTSYSKMHIVLDNNAPHLAKMDSGRLEHYFFRLFQMITGQTRVPRYRMILNSMLSNHLDTCTVESLACPTCLQAAGYIDGLTQLKKQRDSQRQAITKHQQEQ
jgi:hypothetical protein